MSRHMKRLAAPVKWSIPRKTNQWIVRPSPGPHPIRNSLPLMLIVRDMLKLCNTSSEARYLIGKRQIKIDGKVVTDYKFPVGFMDVVTITKQDEHYRVLLNRRGKLRLVKIAKEEALWKLKRIENKTTVRGGKTQLNLHDGHNILIPENRYRVSDVLKIKLEDSAILGVYQFEKGNMAMLIGGNHVGEIATITSMTVTKSTMPNIVQFEQFSTSAEHVFIVGKETPEVTLPEEEAI